MNVYERLAHPVALAVFVFTLFLPVLVGFLTLRQARSQSDFFVGGRAMNRFVVALSAVSSGRSSWLVLGLSGIAWVQGASAVWAMAGYTAVEAVQCLTLGPRLRSETERLGSITLLDYLESRFGDTAHVLRLLGALIIGVFITAYVAAQLNAGAKTLSAALGWNPGLSLVLSALLILAYMVLGGYVAVACFGLLVGGVFAAILSTADSQLLVVASTFARDVYEKVLRSETESDEATKVRLGRVIVVVSGGAAMTLAWIAQDLVFWLVLFAWGGLGASLGPAIILSLFWKGTTRNGVAAGMIAGTVVTMVWKLWLRTPTGLYELVPAFVLATLAIVLVSLAGGDDPRPRH